MTVTRDVWWHGVVHDANDVVDGVCLMVSGVESSGVSVHADVKRGQRCGLVIL